MDNTREGEIPQVTCFGRTELVPFLSGILWDMRLKSRISPNRYLSPAISVERPRQNLISSIEEIGS